MSIEDDLKRVDEWAAGRMQEGSAPPWEWYRLMQLRDAIRGLGQGPMQGALPESFVGGGEYQNAEILSFERKGRD